MRCIKRRDALTLGGAGLLAAAGTARSADTPVVIGVLTDPDGPTADIAGQGSIAATQLAVDDSRSVHPEIPVQVISANVQMRADLSVSIALDWYGQRGVDCIVDVPSSSAALAVANLARAKDRIALFNSAVTTELTGASCSPNHIQWTFDSYALSVGIAPRARA